MNRDIKNIKRDLENKKNNDIIWKKNKLKEMFNEDPDLKEVLGLKEMKPYTKNMSEEEKQAVDEYNEKVGHEQIVEYLKLNGIQTEVQNFIMFDIDDIDVSYTNDAVKNQYLTVMCLVHEDDMETEYEVIRTDLLDYIVKDLLNDTNVLGNRLKMVSDCHDIIDKKYYARIIKYKIETINQVNVGPRRNKYDKH